MGPAKGIEPLCEDYRSSALPLCYAGVKSFPLMLPIQLPALVMPAILTPDIIPTSRKVAWRTFCSYKFRMSVILPHFRYRRRITQVLFSVTSASTTPYVWNWITSKPVRMHFLSSPLSLVNLIESVEVQNYHRVFPLQQSSHNVSTRASCEAKIQQKSGAGFSLQHRFRFLLSSEQLT